MKKSLLVLLVAALLLTSALSASAASLALNHVGATDHPYQNGAEKFAELVKEYTNGSVTIDIFPASQIASGAKAIEMVQTGTLDIAVESTMALSNFVPEVGVLDLPFLFATKEDAFKVLDGAVGKMLEEIAESKGLKIIGWWDNGFRSVTSLKGLIKGPADLKGLKIRTPESTVFLKTFETLGAVPTAMAVAEVFSSLQLGIIDAAENSDSNNIKSKYTEVAPYYSALKHIYTAEPVVMNLDTFNMYTPAEQEAIVKACREATVYQREVSLALDATNMQTIADTGVELFVLEDLTEFQNAVKPVYEFFAAQFGDMITMIQDEVAK